MVFIKKNMVNSFIVRLEDKRSIATSYFLWELTNLFTDETIYFSLEDLSSFQCDYSLFQLEESDSGSKVGGVDLPLSLISGQYEYKIYETLTPSININDAIGGFIEKDMLVVEIDKNYLDFSVEDDYR